jgi:hypothetical protein
MSSQLVDINADGHNDILTGSFEGVPYQIIGSKDGYQDPEKILDVDGEIVLLADFWNYEDEKWDSTDRAKTEGHCTSVSAVDWDADGDLDLLLGDYYGGRLALRINEGTAKEPSFSATNQIVEADGKPMVIAKGLAAPRIVDWNGDGLFDILCGGAKGGVFYFQNIGEKSKPTFAASQTLIDAPDKEGAFTGRVPSVGDNPMLPGSSYHIEPVDFDQDGDLDLLVGARSAWEPERQEPLSDERLERVAEIEVELKKLREKLRELFRATKAEEDAKADDLDQEKIALSDKLQTQLRDLITEKRKIQPDPMRTGDFVWLFRRK